MVVNFQCSTDDISWVQPEGGADGALVFTAFHSRTGHSFDRLDSDRNVNGTTTIEELVGGRLSPEGRRNFLAWNREER